MIERYKGIHEGRRCFIFGSGPSLATMDLSGLKDEITFSCNRGYLMFERLGFHTTYWSCEDALDSEQWHAEFAAMTGPIKFIAKDIIDGNTPFNRTEGFSTEPPFKFGGTVTHFMLQLAAYMGCHTAYLLGNDFRWNSDGGVTDIDSDHFDSNYWPKGSRSFPPQPERMRRAFFGARGHGMRIVNITPGSALDVFETQIFGEYLLPIHMEQHVAEIDGLIELVKDLQPHHVIEIGVNRGGTSALWHELNTGLVIGIDDKVNNLADRFPRFRSVTGSSHLVYGQVAELLDRPADFLFIDGDHARDGVQQDFDEYRRLVRPGGIVAFHDINADAHYFSEAERGGVPAFWKAFDWPGKTEISVGADWGGIGVVKM